MELSHGALLPTPEDHHVQIRRRVHHCFARPLAANSSVLLSYCSTAQEGQSAFHLDHQEREYRVELRHGWLAVSLLKDQTLTCRLAEHEEAEVQW